MMCVDDWYSYSVEVIFRNSLAGAAAVMHVFTSTMARSGATSTIQGVVIIETTAIHTCPTGGRGNASDGALLLWQLERISIPPERTAHIHVCVCVCVCVPLSILISTRGSGGDACTTVDLVGAPHT
jgi:hypothetical protein